MDAPATPIFGLEQIAAVLERIRVESAGKTPAPTPEYDPKNLFANAAVFTNLRQPYIDGIDLGPLRSHIASVEYRMHDDASYAIRSGVMMSTYDDDAGRTHIVVRDKAFELESEEDFLSALIDHELVHVGQSIDPRMSGALDVIRKMEMGKMDCYDRGTAHEMECRWDGTLRAYQHALDLVNAVVEIPAYTHQLTSGVYSTRISEGFSGLLRHNLNYYRQFADVVRRTTGVHPKDIIRHPDEVYGTIKQNVDAIDKALRQQKVDL